MGEQVSTTTASPKGQSPPPSGPSTLRSTARSLGVGRVAKVAPTERSRQGGSRAACVCVLSYETSLSLTTLYFQKTLLKTQFAIYGYVRSSLCTLIFNAHSRRFWHRRRVVQQTRKRGLSRPERVSRKRASNRTWTWIEQRDKRMNASRIVQASACKGDDSEICPFPTRSLTITGDHRSGVLRRVHAIEGEKGS